MVGGHAVEVERARRLGEEHAVVRQRAYQAARLERGVDLEEIRRRADVAAGGEERDAVADHPRRRAVGAVHVVDRLRRRRGHIAGERFHRADAHVRARSERGQRDVAGLRADQRHVDVAALGGERDVAAGLDIAVQRALVDDGVRRGHGHVHVRSDALHQDVRGRALRGQADAARRGVDRRDVDVAAFRGERDIAAGLDIPVQRALVDDGAIRRHGDAAEGGDAFDQDVGRRALRRQADVAGGRMNGGDVGVAALGGRRDVALRLDVAAEQFLVEDRAPRGHRHGARRCSDRVDQDVGRRADRGERDVTA